MITIQYLEKVPELTQLGEKVVIEKLRAAGARLPFSHLIVGWRLPFNLQEACRIEAERLGVRFLRWHPVLTMDVKSKSQSGWQVVGVTGKKVMGYRNMPEFTFACPNHPEIRETIYRRVEDLLREGIYQGFFLDRIRFPSPTIDPLNALGCFCEHCQRRADGVGVELERIRKTIINLAGTEQGRVALIQTLLGGNNVPLDEESTAILRTFFGFRFQSVRELIGMLTQLLKDHGMEIGLDCFSPSLTAMVGQDLRSLSGLADWIKIMCYAHTLGPAGLPFELLHLYNYLISVSSLKEPDVFKLMADALSLPLAGSRKSMESGGISTQALESEVRRGVKASTTPILAGVELVEIDKIVHLNNAQIESDLAAVKRANAAGLAISWDLWHTPLDRLDLVRRVYLNK